MADHGRNADGGTGGGTTRHTGTSDATGAGAPNVVPFPGDWIGPLDELVPIDSDLPEETKSSASSFWDGDPTAVPEAVGSRSHRVSAARSRATHNQPVAGASSWQRPRRRGPSGALISGIVLGLLAVCLVVMVVSGGGLSKGTTSEPSTGVVTASTSAVNGATGAATAWTGAVNQATAATGAGSAAIKPGRAATTDPGRTVAAIVGTKPAVVQHRAEPRRTVAKPVTIARPVTVTVQTPVTQTPALQTGGEVTSPPTVVQHVVAAPAKSSVTSHPTQGATCALSPDSGCLP